MTENQKLNYSNKDLRNCSFEGMDLTGIDFSNLDIRGCEFDEAILINTSFEHVKTGFTYFRILMVLVDALPLSLLIAISAGTGSPQPSEKGVANQFVVGMCLAGSFIAIFLAFSTITSAISQFNQNHAFSIVSFSTGMLISIGILLLIFIQISEKVKGLAGTSFLKANLTNAKFNGSMTQYTNFSEAVLDGVNWTDVIFGNLNVGTSIPFISINEQFD
jgi:uncharacterized protein YjbI with pentapeptide repeats